ncbi:hypothetical protein [Hyphococcus sp.]|uniref:hypothetical protein n=1 Tax=Hyphococcus sp. TaxID=2038636 RepID=UPI003CCC37D0
MRIVTISPIFTPLRLKPGIDPRSVMYREILQAITTRRDLITADQEDEEGDYDNLEKDGYDLRLFEWRPKSEEAGVRARYHIYPNGVSIAQIEFDDVNGRDPHKLEDYAKDETRRIIDDHAAELEKALTSAAKSIPAQYRERQDHRDDRPTRINWIARALVFSDAERKEPACQALIEEWLLHTAHPEDAQKLINGDTDHSMTWVRYVIVENATGRPEKTRMLLSAMRIAQFFYASQKALNDQTQATISRAYFVKNIRRAEKMLVDARAKMQMLRIQYGVQQNFLNRNKRRIFDEIVKVWDFEALIENGARMNEACSARINEISGARRERSAVVTDIILAVIGFLAVIDVSLGLTEYSREVMSRPVLEYTDNQPSRILSAVASVDIDFMLLGGALSIILLIGIYGYWKINK